MRLLKKLRLEKGLSQYDLEKETGVFRQRIIELERETFQFSVWCCSRSAYKSLLKLADYFGVDDPWELVDMVEEDEVKDGR